MPSEQTNASLQKTEVSKLTYGMYVAKLDRPWLETKFAVQGFYVRDNETLHRLQEQCLYVYVDPRRYRSQYEPPKLRIVASNKHLPETSSAGRPAIRPRQILPGKPTTYENRVAMVDEFVPARTSLDDAVAILEPIVIKLRQSGKLAINDVEAAVKPLVGSVLRNRDAVAALLRIRALDEYTYSHSISNAVWAAVLGRHMGFSPAQIEKLALGCALVDIGKAVIPEELLKQPHSPNANEWELIRSHVAAGLEILEESSISDPDVRSIVATHHERFDGSGYPRGLTGTRIPAFGQIAGIVDAYDAMISEQPYSSAMSSFDAVHKLHRDADVLFQRDLVEHLIQAIGVFPTGTLVELNTGEVGIVKAQTPGRRLRPKVTLILNEKKQRRSRSIVTDLNDMDTKGDQPPTVWIKRELPRGAHRIDAAEFFV